MLEDWRQTKLNWYKLTLLDEKAEKIITRALWAIVLLGFSITCAYNAGINAGEEMATKKAQVEIAELKKKNSELGFSLQGIMKRNSTAYFITVDEEGAWLGDIPGQKQARLYNSEGQQMGGEFLNDSTSSSQ